MTKRILTQAGWQNAKLAILVVALLVAAKMDHKEAHHACKGCDTETVVPVLQEKPDVVSKDYFQSKDA